MAVRRGLAGPPCPPPPRRRRSNIPVCTGPNTRYHKPVMSYARPIPQPPPQPPPMPFRYMTVPGRPGRMKPMHPPSFYQQIAQHYPDNPCLSMRELLNLHPGTRPWFRAGGIEALQSRRDRPNVQPGEPATTLGINICGTDPANPYGTGYRMPDFEEYGVLLDDPTAFEITSVIPEVQPTYDWETMSQVQDDRIEAARAGVDWVQQNWNRAFQGQAETWQADDFGNALVDAGDIDEWTSATDFLEAENEYGSEVVFEQEEEVSVEIGCQENEGAYGLEVIPEEDSAEIEYQENEGPYGLQVIPEESEEY